MIEYDDILEKYNTTWDKVSADIRKKNLIEKLFTTTKTLKTNTKSFSNKATDFDDKEILKVGSNHTSLVVISLDSTLKKDENYYPQVFLKECQ